MFGGQIGQSLTTWFSKLTFYSLFHTIDSHHLWAHFADMVRPKYTVICGGSRASEGLAIAPDWAEKGQQRDQSEVHGKGKKKMVK